MALEKSVRVVSKYGEEAFNSLTIYLAFSEHHHVILEFVWNACYISEKAMQVIRINQTSLQNKI